MFSDFYLCPSICFIRRVFTLISLPSSRGGFSCQCFFSLIRSTRLKVWFYDLDQRVGLLDSAIFPMRSIRLFWLSLSGSMARIIVHSARDSSGELACSVPGSLARIIVYSARDSSDDLFVFCLVRWLLGSLSSLHCDSSGVYLDFCLVRWLLGSSSSLHAIHQVFLFVFSAWFSGDWDHCPLRTRSIRRLS